MASKRQALRASSCLGKKTFRTQSAAIAEIEAYQRNRITLGGLSAYRCKFGTHMHIGHSWERVDFKSMLSEFALRSAE